MVTEPLYQEALRPQFHFTARQWTMDRLNPGMRQEGWINDLNGLIYYEGEYHLFAQRWHKCWIHAVSKDLIHWEELEPAFWEEELDSGVQSGTCVIDYKNTSGLSPDPSEPADGRVLVARRQPQPVHLLQPRPRPHLEALRQESGPGIPRARPKVFWYEPGKHWVMFLYGGGQYHIFTSNNLLDWKNEKHPDPPQLRVPGLLRTAGRRRPA